MCRFVAYQGPPVLIADLLYRPRHSLLLQSMRAELMSQPFNADGFGIGFYTQGDPSPCIVRACSPAWSNRGIESIAQRLHATHLFAHIRAASPGMPTQDSNCHPFGHGRFQFMHNGFMENFCRFRRRLQNGLSDQAWEGIEGSTDSEHAFALFIDKVGGPRVSRAASEIRGALVETLEQLARLDGSDGSNGAMICNFAVSDGCSTVVARYARNIDRDASLYYSVGEKYILDGEDGDMLPIKGDEQGAIIVASEPVTRRSEDWIELPINYTLTINAERVVSVEPIAI